MLTVLRINASQFLGAPLYLINEDWYNAWIAFTKQSWGLLTMTMTQWWAPTTVRISGDSTMRGQLLKTVDGSVLCNFPQRMILIANHQIYTDWLYLWWIGYTAGMHGRIYVVLKESLKRIPVIGWGMQFSQFIFLKRKWEQDKPRLAAHLQKFNKPKDPMWLMLFPEGTNLAPSTREASKAWADKNGIKDMQHTLLPRSTGLHFMLQELSKTVDYVYDCTIAYEGVPRGEFAQDIFTVGASYFGGKPPKSVNMYWRRFAIASIPLDDTKKFDLWLRQRWVEKDKFIEDFYRHGKFPADEGLSKDEKGQSIRGAGYIETEIKPKYWYEFLQVFAPIGLFALVLYMFYGALPAQVLDKIKSIDQRKVLKQVQAYQRGEINPEKQLRIAAAKALQDQKKQSKSPFTKAALTQGIVTLNGVPQQDFPVKGSEGKAGTTAAKPKKLPAKFTRPKPVTLNGVPLKDFPAKGLDEAKNTTDTAQIAPTAKPQKGPNVSTQKSTPKKLPATNGPAKKLTPTKLPKTELPKTKLPKTDLKPTAPKTLEPTKPASKPAANAARSKPATESKPHPAPPKSVLGSDKRAASVASEGKDVDSAEVRKARKKAELQGKQLPKRKIRRGLEASAATS